LILAKGNSYDLNAFGVSNKQSHFSCNSRCLSIGRFGMDLKSVVVMAVADDTAVVLTVGAGAIATVAGNDMVDMVNDAVAGELSAAALV
jgi:hypothetical protein